MWKYIIDVPTQTLIRLNKSSLYTPSHMSFTHYYRSCLHYSARPIRPNAYETVELIWNCTRGLHRYSSRGKCTRSSRALEIRRKQKGVDRPVYTGWEASISGLYMYTPGAMYIPDIE